MSILPDHEIEKAITSGDIVVTDYSREALQPASVDLRLGNGFEVFDPHNELYIDPMEDQQLTRPVHVMDGDPFVMHTGQFVLATTKELIGLPPDVVARVEGKSSLGRLGLLIHSTAGFCDPGFRGFITLELSSLAPLPIILRPGMWVCQIAFDRMDSAAERPYGHPELKSRYQHQSGVVPSRYYLDRP